MNLQETVDSLEQNKIVVALDVGVHADCPIDSNCPLAVELRKIVGESGITMAQLLDGYSKSIIPVPPPTAYTLPKFDGKSSITIAGRVIEIDFTDTLKSNLKEAYTNKLYALNNMESQIEYIGKGLYQSYLKKIDSLNSKKELPQVTFSSKELIKTGCQVTGINNKYEFIFPMIYRPEYLVDNGLRYKISPDDVEEISRDVFVIITISKEKKILSVTLYDEYGEKFIHYHGNGTYDCWGNVKMPEKWDGTLKSLSDLVYQIKAVLSTINNNSLMNSEPGDLPSKYSLFERATKLGKEGETKKKDSPPVTPNPTTPRRWGTRTGQQPPLPTEQQEFIRRWGTADLATLSATNPICVLCGRRYMEHSNWVCPR